MYTFSISCNFLATIFTLGLTLSSSVYPFGGLIIFRPLVYVDLADCFAFGTSFLPYSNPGLKTDALLLWRTLWLTPPPDELRHILWATPHPLSYAAPFLWLTQVYFFSSLLFRGTNLYKVIYGPLETMTCIKIKEIKMPVLQFTGIYRMSLSWPPLPPPHPS